MKSSRAKCKFFQNMDGRVGSAAEYFDCTTLTKHTITYVDIVSKLSNVTK